MIEKQESEEVNRTPSENNEFIPKENPQVQGESKYPTYSRMAKNLGGSLVRVAKAALKGEDIKVNRAEKEKRHEICKGCVHYHSVDDRCKLCGCLMSVKTTLNTESCPAGKW